MATRAAPRSVMPSASEPSSSSSITPSTSRSLRRRGAGVDGERAAVDVATTATRTPSRPGPAPRGSPGTAGSTCRRRGRGWRRRGRSGRGRRGRAPRQPRARWACSTGVAHDDRGSTGGRRRGRSGGLAAGAGARERRRRASTTSSWSTAPAAATTRLAGRYQRGVERRRSRRGVIASIDVLGAERPRGRAGGRGTAPRPAACGRTSSGVVLGHERAPRG